MSYPALVKMSLAGGKGKPTCQNPLAADGTRMTCYKCGSDKHFQQDCSAKGKGRTSPPPTRSTRRRSTAGKPASLSHTPTGLRIRAGGPVSLALRIRAGDPSRQLY